MDVSVGVPCSVFIQTGTRSAQCTHCQLELKLFELYFYFLDLASEREVRWVKSHG